MSGPVRGGAPTASVAHGVPHGAPDLAELAEIHSLPTAPAILKPREALRPEEEAVSLPPPEAPDPKIELLNRALGARLTTDNPLWSADPVPRLRGLQKSLIAHSLTLDQAHRRPCLDALTVIERAITLRLRWQQMRRSDAEAAPDTAPERPVQPMTDEEYADATPHAA